MLKNVKLEWLNIYRVNVKNVLKAAKNAIRKDAFVVLMDITKKEKSVINVIKNVEPILKRILVKFLKTKNILIKENVLKNNETNGGSIRKIWKKCDKGCYKCKKMETKMSMWKRKLNIIRNMLTVPQAILMKMMKHVKNVKVIVYHVMSWKTVKLWRWILPS